MHLGNWDAAASNRKLPKKVFSKLFLDLPVWCTWSPEVDWRLCGGSPMVGDFSRVDAADDQAQPGTALLSHPGFQSIFTRRATLHCSTVKNIRVSVSCVFFVWKLTSVTKWCCSVLTSAQRPSESDDRHSSQNLDVLHAQKVTIYTVELYWRTKDCWYCWAKRVS